LPSRMRPERMRPFPRLQAEQDNLLKLCSKYRTGLPPAAKAEHAPELCRLTTALSQVREEVVHPWLVDRIARADHDLAVIELDLVRVLVHELTASEPRDLLYDALVESLCRLLRRRFGAESGRDGEWAQLSAESCDEADER